MILLIEFVFLNSSRPEICRGPGFFFSIIDNYNIMERIQSLLKWAQQNPVQLAIIVVAAWCVWRYLFNSSQLVEENFTAGNFSTCLFSKQIYLNSCSQEEPSNHAVGYLQKKSGRLNINLRANLPYAEGGVFHTNMGAYHVFMIDSTGKQSINLGSMIRDGSRWYTFATALLGDYDNFDRIDVYRQTENYRPVRVLTGSISAQSCSGGL